MKEINKIEKSFKEQLERKIYPVYANFKNQEIIIWGTGNYGKTICKLLNSYNMANNIKGFCNTFVKQDQNETLYEYPIYTPMTAIIKYPNAVYIIASDFSNEILDYIKTNGFESKIKTYISKEKKQLYRKISCFIVITS